MLVKSSFLESNNDDKVSLFCSIVSRREKTTSFLDERHNIAD